MMRPPRSGSVDSADVALAAAYAALDEGDEARARDHAQSVLDGAQARGDQHAEARALAYLAHCDRVGSRLRRASEEARRAAQLFEQLGDMQGEASALTILAHVSMLLGRNDEAVEAAILGVRLCDAQTAQPQTALAYNSLGLAYSWSGDHQRADAALETSVSIARRCNPPLSIYQPRINQMWVEASRLIDERYQTGMMKSLQRMRSLADECAALERIGQGVTVVPGLMPMGRVIALASAALAAAWQGELDAARSSLEAAQRHRSGAQTWLDSFIRWVRAEIAWMQRDWPATEQALVEMRETALAVEHEQLACRAHLLLVQVYELQGKDVEARREQRALRLRERRVAAEGLTSRESLVSYRLGARQSENRLKQVLVASRQFERWSLEDALTGIANRRHAERVLAERLDAAALTGRKVTVAMLDVDKFKSVNDRYTHSVGDRVLKTLAALMASQVREHDLPARWAGDEFLILFDADEAAARQVCDRIAAAVAAFDWNSVAAGLSVSVSIGLDEARADDTIESVVHRSDKTMYRTKPAEVPSPH